MSNKQQYVSALNNITAFVKNNNVKFANTTVEYTDADILNETESMRGQLAHIDMSKETDLDSPRCNVLYEFVRQFTLGLPLDPNLTHKISLDFLHAPHDIVEDLVARYNLNIEYVDAKDADYLLTEAVRAPRATKFETVSRISMFNAVPSHLKEDLHNLFRGAYRNDLSQSPYSFETTDGTGSVVLHEMAIPLFDFLIANPNKKILNLDYLHHFLNNDKAEVEILTDDSIQDICDTFGGILNVENVSVFLNMLLNYDMSIQENQHQLRKILFKFNETKINIDEAVKEAIKRYPDNQTILEYGRTQCLRIGRTIFTYCHYEISEELKPFIVWFDAMEVVVQLFPEDKIEEIVAEHKKVGESFEPVKLVEDNIAGYEDKILNDIVIDFVTKTLGEGVMSKVLAKYAEFKYDYILSQFAITFTFRDYVTKKSMVDVTWVV